MPKLGANLDAKQLSVVNLRDPVADQDAANKRYVDNLVNGLDWKNSARVATTADIDLSSAPASIDGVTLNSGDRVLVKDETDGEDNGIYVFNGAASAMTRATDFDENDEVTANAAVFVSEGTTYQDTGWTLVTDDPITVGTTVQTWTQFTGVGAIVAGDALEKTGNTLNVLFDGVTIDTNGSDELFVPNGGIDTAQLADDSVTAAKLAADTAGDGLVQNGGTGALDVNVDGVTLEIDTDVVQVADAGISTAKIADDAVTAAKINPDVAGNGLVPNGGTGALDVNVDGVTIQIVSDELQVVDQFSNHKYQEDIGDGAATSFNINHALGTADVLVQVFDNGTGEMCFVDVTIVDANNLTVAFDSTIVPTSNQFSVVVLG